MPEGYRRSLLPAADVAGRVAPVVRGVHGPDVVAIAPPGVDPDRGPRGHADRRAPALAVDAVLEDAYVVPRRRPGELHVSAAIPRRHVEVPRDRRAGRIGL